MTPTPSQEEVIVKLRKLMALQTRASTEQEASNAADKISRLLQKHNLEIGVLDNVEEQKGVQGSPIELSAAIQPYDLLIALCADTMMDTKHFINYSGKYVIVKNKRVFKRTINRIVFVGLKANVEASTSVYRYLRESVEFMLNERWKAGSIKGQAECRSYRIGAARKILSMCENIKTRREETLKGSVEGEQCTALILVSSAVAQQYLSEVVKPNSKGKASKVNFNPTDHYAYTLGVQDGSKVDPQGLHKTIKG